MKKLTTTALLDLTYAAVKGPKHTKADHLAYILGTGEDAIALPPSSASRYWHNGIPDTVLVRLADPEHPLCPAPLRANLEYYIHTMTGAQQHRLRDALDRAKSLIPDEDLSHIMTASDQSLADIWCRMLWYILIQDLADLDQHHV